MKEANNVFHTWKTKTSNQNRLNYSSKDNNNQLALLLVCKTKAISNRQAIEHCKFTLANCILDSTRGNLSIVTYSAKNINCISAVINSSSIYQISEWQFSRVLIGSRNSQYHWLFIVFRPASRWRLVSKPFWEDEILAINEAVIQTNTKKATNFGLSVFTGRYKIIFMLKLQQNHKTALDKILELFVNCKQSF